MNGTRGSVLIWNDKKKLQEVTDIVIENISAAYRENSPEYIYFVALYNIFKEFLDDVSEDELPNEATGFIINPEVSKSLSQIGRFAMGEYTLKPEVTAAIANLSKIAAVQSDMAPAMRAINDIAKQIASYKIEIPPAVTELQQRLSEIEFGLLPNSSDAQQDNEEDKPNG